MLIGSLETKVLKTENGVVVLFLWDATNVSVLMERTRECARGEPCLPLPRVLLEDVPRLLLSSEIGVLVVLLLYLGAVLSGEFALEFVIFGKGALVEDAAGMRVERGSGREDGSRRRRAYSGGRGTSGSVAMAREVERKKAKSAPERGANDAGL